LQGLLQACCEDVESDILALTADANDRLDTCGDDTFDALNDLAGLTKPDDELIEVFTQALRGDYLQQRADGEVELVPTGIVIPVLPENCDADSQAALDDLKLADISLGDCLSFKKWLEGKLAEACSGCEDDLTESIDDNWIIL